MSDNKAAMTVDAAIKSLQNIIEYWSTRESEQRAVELAIAALQEQKARENPVALTRDELEAFNGKPVYVKSIDTHHNYSGWVILNHWLAFFNVFRLEDYGTKWIAYAFEPVDATQTP